MKKKLLIYLFIFTMPLVSLSQGFTTDNTNGNLLDACGKNFVMKGMSVPLAWYVSNVNGSIAALKTNTKSNCLRIVVSTTTPDNDWQTCVRNCISNKIIPMVELHNVTGNTSAADLKKMGDFWASKAAFFNSTNSNGVNIQKHILINLANEWGTWQTATDGSNGNTAWRDAVIGAIKPIRDAGIKTTIVIDAVGYGQDVKSATNIQKYAKAIQTADAGYLGTGAKANLLFSIHMYCQWATGGDSNPNIISTIKNSGIPLIVGEFGYQHDAGNGNVCDIPEQTILNTCQTNGIGWLAWSQKGNGSPVQYLDLCNDWACTQLSAAWGATIVNGTNGTKTALECSVFSTTSCSTTSCNTPAPTVTATKSLCQNTTATSLTATGTALKWYTASTGGVSGTVAPIPGTATAGSTSYYVSQTLNNCEGPRAIITVTVNASPVVEPFIQVNGGAWTVQQSATLCAGGSVNIGPHPVDLAGWTWTGPNNFTSSSREINLSGVTTTQGGTYTASYKDANGCSASVGIPVTINSRPIVNITSPTTNATITSSPILISANVTGAGINNVKFYNGTTLLGTDATSPYSFSWANSANGVYTVNVIANNVENCADTSTIKFSTSIITGVEEIVLSTGVDCFPNPFTHSFTLKVPGKSVYEIYDITGISVDRGSIENSITIGQNLPSGTYLIKIQNGQSSRLLKINKF